MSPAQQPQPRAQGDLGQTPLAHLVLYLYRQGLSGTLVIRRGVLETQVLFRSGRAVAARGLARGSALHAGLVELCWAGAASYAFWDNDLIGSLEGATQGTVDPFQFVAESVRGSGYESVIASVVDRYEQVQLLAVPEADPKRFGLRGAEARVVEMLRVYPLTIDALAKRSLLDQDAVRRIVYLLLVTHMAAPSEASATSTSGVRAAVQVPSERPQLPAPSSASSQSMPAVLRTPRPSGPPSARPAAGGFSQRPRNMSPAWQQLAVPSASMAPPPIESLDDAGKFRRAEQLAERRNFVETARILDDLIGRDPYHAGAQGLRAWMAYQQWSTDEPPRLLLDALDRALLIEETQPRALFVKGLVQRRLGKEHEALRCFQQVLQANPRHVDARRELRLARMRRER